MKILKFTAILLVLAVTSCKEKEKEEKSRTTSCWGQTYEEYLESFPPGTIGTDSLCLKYQGIWKEIFMEKNGLSEDYFNKHIEIKSSYIGDWNDGTSYSVGYYIKTEWAVTYNEDQFIININNELYPALEVPRGTYLTKEDIVIVLSRNAYSSGIIKLSPDESLNFKSLSEALEFLTQKADVATLCFGRIFIDKNTGHINLEAYAKYDNEFNSCILADLDLINGTTNIQNTPCYIN